jgi:hypothetical protein
MFCLLRTGRDAHLHFHAEMVRREPDEGAVERGRVMRIADDRNGDKADLDAVPTIVVLVGAELNSEIEHQTARDSTLGPDKPLGIRGAVMADTVGPAKA